MAQSRQAIQARISSVSSTKKITKAMQLIASSKLTRQRQIMEENRSYAQGLQELFTMVLRSAGDDSMYLNENQGKPSFIFVITSDMGLCGYNATVYRMMQDEFSEKDHVVMMGIRGSAWISKRNYNVKNVLSDLDEDDVYDALSKCMQDALDLFEKKEISKIQILYTHYKNTLTFVPTLETVLPVSKPQEEKKSGMHADMIFEPDKETMLQNMIPMVTKSILYSRYLESKTSEQASRRMAMESATDNAEELQDNLELAYNRVRQGAITQEITEIVGGANALS